MHGTPKYNFHKSKWEIPSLFKVSPFGQEAKHAEQRNYALFSLITRPKIESDKDQNNLIRI